MAKSGNENLAAVPWSEESERALLGCCFTLMESCQETLARVTGDWFYSALHRGLWEVLWEMQVKQLAIDSSTVLSRVMAVKGADDVAYRSLVLDLSHEFSVVTPALLQYHVGEVCKKFQLRRLMEIGAKSVELAREFHEDPIEPIAKAESMMFDLLSAAAGEASESRGAMPVRGMMDLWLEEMEKVARMRGRLKGLGTGLHDLDRTFNGLDDEEGEIITIAARPGGGKTALAVTILEHLVKQEGAPGVLYSLEMSKVQILNRLILGSEEVDTSKAITGMFKQEELRMISSSADAFRAMPFFINDSPDVTTADLRAEVQVMKRKHGIRWIMIDYLALVKPVEEAGKKDERMAIVEVMKTLHFLKKQCKLVVFLLVQMNRESDRNKGAAPVMADLQGSAAIEQFSDHILFITRPVTSRAWNSLSDDAKDRWVNEVKDGRRFNPDCWADGQKYYDTGEKFPAERQDYEEHAVFYIKKNRRGPTPELKVRFIPEWTRFANRTPKIYSNDMTKRQA